jgi:hypothetical protein
MQVAQAVTTKTNHVCPPMPHTRAMNHRVRPSEGFFVYVLGLVIVATSPSRFWLGFALAGVPIAVNIALRVARRR